MFSRSVKSQELLPAVDQLSWRKLQQVGLNAYEARSYLVLMGHPRFKALDLAGRAHVPRQKVYEVLDSLVEKGFAQVVQDKTKLFSAVDPGLAIPSFLARRNKLLESQFREQERLAYFMIEELRHLFLEGQGREGALTYLSLVNDATQTAVHHRRMLDATSREYAGVYPFPLEPDLLNEEQLSEARSRGITCRLLVQVPADDGQSNAYQVLNRLREQGVMIRFLDKLLLQLSLFDSRRGVLTLLDPVRSTPSWTSVIFEHEGFTDAMLSLFESYWQQGREYESAGPAISA